MVVSTVCFCEKVGSGTLSRQEQDFAGRQHFADCYCSVDSVQPEHDDVADEHIGPKSLRGLNGFFTGIDSGGFKSVLFEDESQSVGNHAFVVGNQHFELR